MKRYKVSLTPDAIKDLEDIYDYIKDKSGYAEIAWLYMDKLRSKCNNLGIAPFRGHKRDDLHKNLRIVAIDKHAVAAFKINQKRQTVLILNIFYGGKDYDAIMHYQPNLSKK